MLIVKPYENIVALPSWGNLPHVYIEKTNKTPVIYVLLISKTHNLIKHSPLFVVFLTVILG